MHKPTVVVAALSALLSILEAPATDAQSFPVKPVRMVTTSGPGGSADGVARILARKMSDLMGQQVIVDARPGAGGSVGTVFTVRSPPDGYTIILQTIPLVVNPSLQPTMQFDVAKDLAPISLIAAAPFILVVHPSVPVKTVKELIALAKKQPGKLNYSSGVSGTNSHIAMELFKSMTATNIVNVPYKDGGAALSAILSGEAHTSILGITAALSQIKAGKIRALGITSRERSTIVPDLSTIAESGVPGYDFTSWYRLLAPAATPAPIINALNDYTVKSMRSPDMAQFFAGEGADVIASTPAEFATYIKVELVRWAKVIKEAGLSPK